MKLRWAMSAFVLAQLCTHTTLIYDAIVPLLANPKHLNKC